MSENNDERDPKENEYPSSPGADETPQEPASGEASDAPEPEAEPHSYPSTPDEDGKDENNDDGHRGTGEGPGAAKASEPHQRDHGGSLNAPPAPTRPPASAGTIQPPPNPGAEQPPSEDWPDDPPSYPGTERPSSLWADHSSSGSNTNQEEHVTYLPPADWQGAPFGQQPPTRPRRKSSKAPLLLGIGIAAALVVGIILLITALTGTRDTGAQPNAGSNGIIAEDVSPFDFEEGQCFTEFADATQPATVVTCETPHQAQLVNTFSYEDDAGFPGEDALADRASELCRNTELSQEANQYEERLRQQTAYPQPESWEAGDRRVDCFIRITSGQITGSLID
ncbi:septum formation family protein [Arthrobacter monumenti]